MSQRTVESVIGRLVTDEAFRRRFSSDPPAALREVVGCGHELTPVELHALGSIDPRLLALFADALDPRIQKVECEGGRA